MKNRIGMCVAFPRTAEMSIKPMHMQPIYRLHPFVTREGNGRARTNAYIAGGVVDVGMDIFQRGLCLPSDNKMTVDEQQRIIEVIRACFE